MKFDWLVVGAGLTGLTFARQMASQRNERVLLIDERPHLGGNIFDEFNEHGVLVHKYGPHIFHTNSERVWNYLSEFTAWRAYEHRVLGLVDGKWVPLPFNLDTIERLFPAPAAADLRDRLLSAYGADAKVPILELRRSEDADLRALADYVYDKVFLEYTRKQWALEPEDLDPAVTARVPIMVSRDDRYFQDTYQAMPEPSYAAMAQAIADHPNISVQLGTPFDPSAPAQRADRIFFTGQIDRFFDFRLGELPYRSMRFEHHTLPVDRFQTTGTHNYPGSEPHTRITEQKVLTGQRIDGITTIVTEYPMAHIRDKTDPFYPIPRPENRSLYARYASLAESEAPHVIFAGRLGDYQYYNMDQAVARALAVAQRI